MSGRSMQTEVCAVRRQHYTGHAPLRLTHYLLGAGKFSKHVDAWDCLQDQEFPSLEAYGFVLRQLFQLAKPPNRYTPEFLIFKKYKDWEIRR